MGGGGGSRKKRNYTREVPHTSYTKPTSTGGIPLFDDCESLVFKAEIVMVTTVTAGLVVGEELLISLDSSGNTRLFNNAGNHCGNIIGRNVGRMIVCMNKGHDYFATVVTVAPTYTVRVQIRR